MQAQGRGASRYVAPCQEPVRGALEIPVPGIAKSKVSPQLFMTLNRAVIAIASSMASGAAPSRSTARASSAVRSPGLRVRTSKKARVARGPAGNSARWKSSRAASTAGRPSSRDAIAPWALVQKMAFVIFFGESQTPSGRGAM
jgi:hypothetical protein